eukprot:72850-Prorocentrum_minimum.AAC.1
MRVRWGSDGGQMRLRWGSASTHKSAAITNAAAERGEPATPKSERGSEPGGLPVKNTGEGSN